MLLYRFLSLLVLAAYTPYALLRSLAGRRRLGDIRGRLGFSPYPDLDGGIWVHAVSVGEVRVAGRLLGALARKSPGARLGLSVTTAAGRELAQRDGEAGSAVFAFPLDLARPVERSLAAVRPGLVVLTETEIWPLFLDRAAAHGIPVALVNGRISGRSFRRYALAGRFLARTLGRVSLFAMQTREDAERIARLGAPPQRIRVTGNIKYDLAAAPPFADAARLEGAASGRPVVVAASTADGEEAVLLEAWKRLSPRPLLAIAPRRPERFDDVARLIESSGFTVLRRSSPDSGVSNHQSPIINHQSLVYLLDSIGELASLYREASVAFLGGSLAPVGGHNPIEAWAQGVPVIVGPHTENFREITACGERLGFARRAADARSLSDAFEAALADPAARAACGERARRFVAENRGAADATADLVLPLLFARSDTAAAK